MKPFFQRKLRPMGMFVPFEIWVNYLFFHEFEVTGEVKVTISEKMSICWMVVHFMESNELTVLQVCDVLGVTSRVEAILAILEEVLVEFVYERTFGITHSSLHLVVNHPFVLQTALRIIRNVELQPMTFLPEIIVV